jgi:homoserine acetyltransferase
LRLKRALVIGVKTDILFPLHQQSELAEGLSQVVDDVEYLPLDCIKGHDSFLVDMDEFRPIFFEFFETCATR